MFCAGCIFELNFLLPPKTNEEATAVSLKKSKEEYAQIIQSKDLSLQELHRCNNQQAEKLEQIQATIGELQNSLALAAER